MPRVVTLAAGGLCCFPVPCSHPTLMPTAPQAPGSWSTTGRHGTSTASSAAAASSPSAPAPSSQTRRTITASRATRASLPLAAPTATRSGAGEGGGQWVAQVSPTETLAFPGTGCREGKLQVQTLLLCPQSLTKGGVTYRDEPWHKECFVCTGCRAPLAGQQFTSQDDQPYCVKCFGSLYAKKCSACTKPITGEWHRWGSCRQAARAGSPLLFQVGPLQSFSFGGERRGWSSILKWRKCASTELAHLHVYPLCKRLKVPFGGLQQAFQGPARGGQQCHIRGDQMSQPQRRTQHPKT